jgi:hypothetical protein
MVGEYQNPIKLGLYNAWLTEHTQQEHYINMAELVQLLHSVTKDGKFKLAVEQNFGTAYWKELDSYVSRVGNPNIYKAFTWADVVSRTLRKNMAIAYLSFNVVTMAKQFPSIALYLGEAGIHRILGAALNLATHPVALVNEVHEKAPQIAGRSINRMMEEFKDTDGNLYQRNLNKFGRIGMKGIMAIDHVTVCMGWKAVYEARKAHGYSEEDARIQATEATLRTQPAGHAKDLAGLYTDNELMNWFTMFSNQLNQIYNMATYDVPMSIRRGAITAREAKSEDLTPEQQEALKKESNESYYRAFGSTVGMAVSAIMIWSMTHKDIPDEPEDFFGFGGAFFEWALNMIPIFGKEILTAWQGYDSGLGIMKPARSIGMLLASAEDGKGMSRTMKALWEAASVVTGVPYSTPARILRAFQNNDMSLLLGGAAKKTKSYYKKATQGGGGELPQF